MSLSEDSHQGFTSGAVPIAKLSTGIRGLDTILKGGLPAGRVTMISGGPGSGKTVLAMEFLYRRALTGEAGVFLSFEERAEDLRANAAAMSMDVAAQEEAGNLAVVYADVPHGAVRSGAFDIRGLLAIIEGHARALGATCVVLDALDVLMRVFGDPEREREELYVLHDWLRERGLTVIMTVKSDASGRQVYPFLDFMADCVLLLDQRMRGQIRTRRLNVVKFRGSDYLSNEHPYVFSSSGLVLLPISSMSLVQQPLGGYMSSGNEALDSVLGGGYPRGACVLVAGSSGSGKTTAACTFARAACEGGEKVLYVGFEEAGEVLAAQMLSAGVDLQPALEAGTLKILTALPESVGLDEHLLRVMEETEAFAPSHVVVDAISACRRMGSEAAAFDFLVRLLTYCKEGGMTCFYTNQVAHAEQAMEISGYGISSLVDTLLLLQYDDDEDRLRRRLLVIKSRGSSHSLRYHEFQITDHGIRLELTGKERKRGGSEP